MVKWRDFFHNTSIPGLTYCFYRRRSDFEMCFWICAFLICIICLLIMFINMFNLYYTQAVHTFINRVDKQVTDIPIPAITICLRPFFKPDFDMCSWNQKEKLDRNDNIIRAIIFMSNREKVRGNAKLHFIKWEEFENTTMLGTDNFLDNIKCHHSMWNTECFESWQVILTPYGKCYSYNMISVEELYRDDVVLFNTSIKTQKIKNYDVNNSDYTKKWNKNERFGLNVYPHRIQGAGRRTSISMYIRPYPMGKWKYGCLPDKSFGMFVAVHNPTELPDWSKAMSALQNYSSEITYVPVKMDMSESVLRNAPNIRGCYAPGERNLRFFKLYTAINCDMECLTNLTFQMCGCVQFYMPMIKGTLICGPKKSRCIKSLIKQFGSKMYAKCQCLPICKYVEYITKISKASLIRRNETEVHGEFTNATKLVVYSKVRMIREFVKQVSFTELELLSGIGGLLGMFINFSLVCLFEFIYFPIRVILWAFRRRN